MKKAGRGIYIVLAAEINATLCGFCKHGNWECEGCCDGYNTCEHPIDALSFMNSHEEGLELGGDCYGFAPSVTVDLLADIVGAILTQGYGGGEWFYRKFSPTSVTIYGIAYAGGGKKTGKVRIG